MQRAQEQIVDRQVEAMLAASPGFRQLPADQRSAIQRDTAAIVKTMAENELAQAPRDPYAVPLTDGLSGFDGLGGAGDGGSTQPQFTGGAQPGGASEYVGPTKVGDFGSGVATGVSQAGALLRQVNFPAFVAELVKGVFQAVVDASIQQMEAYGELVQSVAMSLNDFRDANVSENQGRDHLVSKFPNLMQINVTEDGPRVGLRDDPEDEDLASISSSLGLDESLTDLDEETIEGKLVPAARNDLARSRQSLLATMLLMGINRIIVTDGKINAKMKFDFRATDSTRVTARDFDYQNFGTAKIRQEVWDKGREKADVERNKTWNEDKGKYEWQRSSTGGSRWSRGQYQDTEAPVIKLTNVTDTDTVASLEAKAKLTGEVSLNFRSETFDINQLASADEVFRLERVRSAGRGAPPPTQTETAPAQDTTATA